MNIEKILDRFLYCLGACVAVFFIWYAGLMHATNPDYGLYQDDHRWNTVQDALIAYGTDSALQIVSEMDSVQDITHVN